MHKENDMSNNQPLSRLLVVFGAVSALAGCASGPITSDMSSPLRSTDQANKDICPASYEDAMKIAEKFPVGTPREDIYKALKLDSRSLALHSKEDTNRALYGQANLQIPFEQREAAQQFLNSIQSTSLVCRDIQSDKKFGLTASEQVTRGTLYTMTFVFRKDEKDAWRLYDPIRVSSTPVEGKNRKGYLNELNPFGILRSVTGKGM